MENVLTAPQTPSDLCVEGGSDPRLQADRIMHVMSIREVRTLLCLGPKGVSGRDRSQRQVGFGLSLEDG